MAEDVAVAPVAPNEEAAPAADIIQEAAPAVVESAEGVVAPAAEGSAEGGQALPPDTYADFAMPEGITVDNVMLEAATPIFKEIGLTQEQAQKLVDFQAGQVQAGSERQNDDFNQMMGQWQKDSQNDSEFGGDNFDENIAIAQSAVDKFGTPELKQLLSDHGVGNHPEMIRFMVKVGKLTQEDVPGGSTNAIGGQTDRVQSLYPNAKSA